MTLGHLGTNVSREYESINFDHVRKMLKPGMLVYDIGAYDGITSVIDAECVGASNVVIVEPGEMNWATIEAYWRGNNLSNPRATYAGFLSDADKPAIIPRNVIFRDDFPPEAKKFPARSTEDGLNFRVLEYRSLYPEVAALPWLKLDTLALHAGSPDAITMDVEGAELLVLKGADKALRTASYLWISVHPKHMREHFGQTPEELHGFLRVAGYAGTLVTNDHEEHWFYEKVKR